MPYDIDRVSKVERVSSSRALNRPQPEYGRSSSPAQRCISLREKKNNTGRDGKSLQETSVQNLRKRGQMMLDIKNSEK